MTYFEKKKFHPLLRPQSADRNTLDWLQRAETHFLHKLFFKILFFWAKQYSSGPSFSYLNNWRWLVYSISLYEYCSPRTHISSIMKVVVPQSVKMSHGRNVCSRLKYTVLSQKYYLDGMSSDIVWIKFFCETKTFSSLLFKILNHTSTIPKMFAILVQIKCIIKYCNTYLIYSSKGVVSRDFVVCFWVSFIRSEVCTHA
jgi:hypothetical protein